MFRVQVADDFPAPAVFIGALKMFAGVNGPEYISRLAFVIYGVFFRRVVAETCADGGMDFIDFWFLRDDIDNAALRIGTVKRGGGTFQNFDTLNGRHIGKCAEIDCRTGNAVCISPHTVYEDNYIRRTVDKNFVGRIILSAGGIIAENYAGDCTKRFRYIIEMFLRNLLACDDRDRRICVNLFFFRPGCGNDHLIKCVHRHIGSVYRKNAAEGSC